MTTENTSIYGDLDECINALNASAKDALEALGQAEAIFKAVTQQIEGNGKIEHLEPVATAIKLSSAGECLAWERASSIESWRVNIMEDIAMFQKGNKS